MSSSWDPREHGRQFRFIAVWALLASPVAAVVGTASAGFLWALDWVTRIRWENPWLLYLLPLAGVGIVQLYRRVGRNSEAGNNLIIEEIHEPGGGVPARMAPLVLLTTLLTHLFGGSAGREGTAVQMGGSIAATAGRWMRLTVNDLKVLLMCGVAAGFAAVFGTPIAATIFALEVLAIGRVRYHAMIPCLIAALVADQVCLKWGIRHTAYAMLPQVMKLNAAVPSHLNAVLLAKVAVAAVAFGLASVVFALFAHGLQNVLRERIKLWWLRPLLGGIALIALTYLAGTRDYLGLGVTTPTGQGVSIVSSFAADGATPMSWAWKTLFTVVTLSAGFKGGEVTPLFFIGATLGNAMSKWLGVTGDYFALLPAVGFVAVFAGATNTPLACTFMAFELFSPLSPAMIVYFFTACFVAYAVSGRGGIYRSQRIDDAHQPSLLHEK